jgi:hypothetical protein
MNPSAILKPWQPVAIHAITQFMKNPLLKGCILADGVGLWENMGNYWPNFARESSH